MALLRFLPPCFIVAIFLHKRLSGRLIALKLFIIISNVLLPMLMLFSPLASAQGLQQTYEQIDSLQQEKRAVVQQKENKADSLLEKSLHPVEKLVHTADSVSELLNVEKKVNQQVSQAENKVEEKIQNLEKVQQSKEAIGNIERETSLSTPDGVVPSAGNLNLPGQPQGVKTTLPTNQIKGLPQKGMEQVKGLEGMQVAGEHLDQIKAVSNQTATYKKDLKVISQGKPGQVEQLHQTAEQTLQNTKEIKALQQQQQALQQAQQQPEQVKKQVEQLQDQEQLKAKAKQKLMEQSVDHLAHHQKELQAVQQKVSKLKRKYSYVNEQTGEKVKRTSLKGHPLKERITWGTTLQIHAGATTSLDLSPFVGYRFSKRWSSGIGGTYRFSFDGENQLLTHSPIFGGRLYGECVVYKKFLLHAEYERLKAYVPNQIITPGESQRLWTEGVMVGAGKSYQVIKKLKGNVLLLRNFTYVAQGPYQLKWNVRFGFYF